MQDDDMRVILKRARELMGVTREALAKRGSFTAGHIANIENGYRRITEDVITAYAAALGASLLVQVWKGNAMQRRAVVRALGLVTAGSSVVLSDALRMSTMDSFGVPESWKDVSDRAGEMFLTQPAHDVHRMVSSHLLLLGDQADRPGAREAASRLMLLYGQATANTGEPEAAIGWYRAARQMADSTGDVRLITWIRGREAFRWSSDGVATPDQVLHLTSGLDDRSSEGHLARAYALARLGERTQALAALADAERAYPHTDQSEGTAYGFQPWRLALCTAYVSALLGDVKSAERASSVALPSALIRFAAQRELTSAVALATAGDKIEAAATARRVLDDHPAEQSSTILTTMVKEAGL